MNFDGILQRLEGALAEASQKAASIFVDPKNARSYGCFIHLCDRRAYSRGLCNAHYLRERAGKPMDVPVRARKREDLCAECGKKTGAKGGWGLCTNHYKTKRYQIVKDALIEALGGKCSSCGGVFHRSVYDFHHKGDKQGSPSNMIVDRSVEEIAKEIAKCVLLCANCHRLEHNNEL